MLTAKSGENPPSIEIDTQEEHVPVREVCFN